MRIKLPFRRELIVSLKRHVTRVGVSSDVGDNKHILLWDFDNVDRELVIKALRMVQWSFDLPHILVVPTRADSFHAYCLEAFPWARCLAILAATAYLDPTYFKMGVVRGYFTLRVEDLPNRPFGTPFTLGGSRRGSLQRHGFTVHFVRYDTTKG